MTGRLLAHHGEHLVGELEQRADGLFRFTYAEQWLTSAASFPLSLSLPLQRPAHGDAAHAFFSNLLPEGELRGLLCRRLGISPDNDFELLRAIGGECAGAVVLSANDEKARPEEAKYRTLTHKELEELARTQVLPAIDGRTGLRLSLAGAQDKLPVLLEGTSIHLPIGNSPSTHILKFPNRHYKHLPANEVLVMMIARKLDLPVADAELWELRREGMCVVARYDRARVATGGIERIHQEDLCQANGVRPARKYEKEGGPGFKRCFETIRRASVDPITDAQHLIRWLAFNVIALNADAHAKNLSILYSKGGPRLAPFYDLVCTRAYPRLAPELAMAVGGEFAPTQVLRRDWETLARDLGVGERFLLATVVAVAEQFPDAASAAAKEFRERYGETPALQLVLPKIRKQAKKVARV